MYSLIINYIFMVVTFVYASVLFCDIYFRTKSSKAKFNLLFLPLSIILLSTGFLLELSTEGHFVFTLFPSLMIYTGFCFIGYAWLTFSYFIAQKNKEKCSLLNIISLIPLLLVLLLIVTNPLHNLLYIQPHSIKMDFNSEYLCILILSGVYVLLANIILLNSFLRNKAISFKLKITFLIVLAFIPIFFYVRIFHLRHFELVPACLLLGYHVVLRCIPDSYKPFEIVPNSITSIVQNMEHSILITNKKNNIVTFNSSFTNAFGSMAIIKESTPLDVFVETLKQSTVLNMESHTILDAMLFDIDKNISGNIHVNTPIDKWYFVLIQNVLNSKGKKIGKLISFNDITTIHNLNHKLKQKNYELEKINLQLKNTNEKVLKHTLMAEELAITRERNRILSELHDSIGQAYTSNLALARCTEALLLSNRREEALDSLEEMASTTKELLFNISSSVNDKHAIFQQQPLKDILNKLFNSYRKSGMAIQFRLDTDVDILEYRIRHNIYRICQEFINNSLKHSMAENIYISIKEINGKIILEIADDGIGCDMVYKGIGLKGIEYRISEIEGEVLFISDKSRQKGFIIRAEIPIKRESKQ